MPRMAFNGVRNSWLICARNRDFAALADSASAQFDMVSWCNRLLDKSADRKYPRQISAQSVDTAIDVRSFLSDQ